MRKIRLRKQRKKQRGRVQKEKDRIGERGKDTWIKMRKGERERKREKEGENQNIYTK